MTPRDPNRPSWFPITYLGLLVFEGALRKWVLPGYSDLLYLAKDASVVVALCLLPKRHGPVSFRSIWPVALLASAGLLAWGLLTTEPLASLLVGARNYLSPLLAAVIMISLLTRDQWNNLSRLVILSVTLQVPIALMQVALPAGAFINRGTEINYEALTTTDGVVRASGTFTSTTGLAAFALLGIALALYELASARSVTRRQTSLILALVALVALSGSRQLLFGTAVVVLCAGIALARNHRAGSASILVVAATAGVGAAAWLLPGVYNAFAQRIDAASRSEDLVQRVLGDLFPAVDLGTWAQLVGAGPGARSLSGIAAGAAGPWVENESARWVVELGLVGLALVCAKMAFAAWLVFRCASDLARGRSAGLLALPVIFLLLFFGYSTQPTTQGAFALAIGLYVGLALRTRDTRQSTAFAPMAQL